MDGECASVYERSAAICEYGYTLNISGSTRHDELCGIGAQIEEYCAGARIDRWRQTAMVVVYARDGLSSICKAASIRYSRGGDAIERWRNRRVPHGDGDGSEAVFDLSEFCEW